MFYGLLTGRILPIASKEFDPEWEISTCPRVEIIQIEWNAICRWAVAKSVFPR